MRKLYSILVVLLSLTGLWLAPVAAATVSGTDARAVQLVVRAQLDAFAADDAERAFSFAAPSIQQMFGTPEQFMLMVRTSYPVVYRPASVTFLKPKPSERVLLQPVHMTDGQGGSWLALYRLQRQKDKSWRIAGCVLVADRGQAI